MDIFLVVYVKSIWQIVAVVEISVKNWQETKATIFMGETVILILIIY